MCRTNAARHLLKIFIYNYCLFYFFFITLQSLTMLNYKSMKNSRLEKPTFIEVGLTVFIPHLRRVSASVSVVVLSEQVSHYASEGVDLVSLLDSSLSPSLAYFFPSHSIVSVDICFKDSSLVAVSDSIVFFKGCDTFHIASKLAADILGQIL